MFGRPFTLEEDAIILEMARSSKRPDWGYVVQRLQMLGYTRSAHSCFTRSKKINKPIGFNCVNRLVKSAIRKVLKLVHNREMEPLYRDPQKNRNKGKRYRDRHVNDVQYMERQRKKNRRNQPRASMREKERYHLDLQFRALKNTRNRFHHIMNSIGAIRRGKTADKIGCTPFELKEHLKSTLSKKALDSDDDEWDIDDTTNMHIDHIFPLSRYNLHEEEQQFRAMHYSNLQMLAARTNMIKSNKLPSLDMARRVERWAWPDDITEADLF